MPVVVEVKSPEDYAVWMEERKAERPSWPS